MTRKEYKARIKAQAHRDAMALFDVCHGFSKPVNQKHCLTTGVDNTSAEDRGTNNGSKKI